ncbi:MAG: hypothetical protein HYY06_13220 [Deltaproteobacteria bacterium]|nr:hypothetical protein [Deltaproteobacteria bacterium]
MADAYEVALTWRGDLLRAELYQGAFEVWAGGTSRHDLPLPVEGRHLLFRSDARGALLLSPPGGAEWALDDGAGQGAAVSPGDSVARLQVADLEIAVQATTPAEPLPRWNVPLGAWRVAAAHIAAYGALAFILNLPVGPAPSAPARADTPRPVALRPLPDTGPLPSFVSGRTETRARRAATSRAPGRASAVARRQARPSRTGSAPRALLPDDGRDRIEDLATAPIEIATLDDLADPAEQPAACGDAKCAAGHAAGRSGRGGSHGAGVGTCARAHFQGLALRHGRTAAIVACSPGPRLGSAPAALPGESVVLRDQGPDARLAAEVWSWDGSGRR